MPFALVAPDGAVAIMYLAPGADLGEAVAKFAKNPNTFMPTDIVEIAAQDIPSDKSRRNDWRLVNGRISVPARDLAPVKP